MVKVVGTAAVLVACASFGATAAQVEELLRARLTSSSQVKPFGRVLQSKGDDSPSQDDGCGPGLGNKFVQPEEVFTPGSAPPEIIGVASCWKPGSASRTAVERMVVDVRPDIQFWLGDQMYADTTDPNTQRAAYKEKKDSCDFRPFLGVGIPTRGVWDDHDYGDNNMVKYHPNKAESQAIMLEHFDVPETDPRHKQEGVYNAFLAGNKENGRVHMVMVDDRSHHSATFANAGPCEGDKSSMLGDEQWAWLEDQLENTESEILVFMSGLQVLPPTYRGRWGTGDNGWSTLVPRKYCAWDDSNDGANFVAAIADLGEQDMRGKSNRFLETWGEFPLERKRLLRLLQKIVNEGKTKMVIIASGDVHFATIMRMTVPATEDYKAVTFHEITSSGFSQNPNPSAFFSVPYDVVSPVLAGANFGSIDIDWEGSKVTLKIHTDRSTSHTTYNVVSEVPFGVTRADPPQRASRIAASEPFATPMYGEDSSSSPVLLLALVGGSVGVVVGVSVFFIIRRRQHRRALDRTKVVLPEL